MENRAPGIEMPGCTYEVHLRGLGARRASPAFLCRELTVEDLLEIRAPEGGADRFYLGTIEWARRRPSEEIWKARKGSR